MPLKFVTGHQEAVTNLYTDVGTNAVVCFDVKEFPVSSLAAFYPPGYPRQVRFSNGGSIGRRPESAGLAGDLPIPGR